MPGDLAALDRVLGDQALMGPILERFRRELLETGRRVLEEGRPTIPMETFVRLMVLKARYRWGYWMLVGEVSDSIALRRFCRISLCERVPDESTVRKLTRRLGPERVSSLTRMLVVRAARERRFWPRAVRVDSTVVEADVKYPTDSGLASPWRQGAGAGSSQAGGSDRREQAAGAGSLAGGGPRAAGDHSHNPGSFGGSEGAGAEADRADGGVTRTLGQGSTPARGGRQAPSARSWREAQAERRREARGAGRPLREGRTADQTASGRRAPITSRIVSIADPDARPIRKSKLGKPNEFGYVTQLAEVTENTKREARGLILPASTQVGNPQENALLPDTAAELKRLGISPRARSPSTAGFSLDRPAKRSQNSRPNEYSSLATRNPAPDAPTSGPSATEPARRATSATSSAATGWAAAA